MADTPRPARDILILLAHPDLGRSSATAALLAALRESPVAGRVELRDLYRLYPDFHIHVAAEQQALGPARLVVLLHPIYWYSMPALQKLWLDEVLRLGWAYGPGGHALKGKDLWLVASTGGGADSYSAEGHNRHPIADFLLPLQHTAQLCGMHWLPPLVLHGAHRAGPAELAAQAGHWLGRLAAYPDWCAAPGEAAEPEVALDERPALFTDLSGEAV